MSVDSRRTPIASFALHSRDNRPGALLLEAVSAVTSDQAPGRSALDVGAGAMAATRYLLDAGWRVTAVDPDPHAAALAREFDASRFDMRCADIRDVDVPAAGFDLVAAVHVLHLLPRPDIERLVPVLVGALRVGGVLCATFLGPRDTWAATPWRATAVERSDVEAMTAGLTVLRLDERQHDGVNVLGESKHWHVIQCVLRNDGI